MASKIKVTRQKVEMLEKEGPETPLLDLSDAAVKALIRSAKKRGYVTHDRINALLSSEEVKSEQIEDILAKFSEMGVNVIETEEAEPENEGAREEPDDEEESEGDLVEVKPKLPAKSGAKDPACEMRRPNGPCNTRGSGSRRNRFPQYALRHQEQERITAPGTEFFRPETRRRIRHILPARDQILKITYRIGRANAAYSSKVSVIRDSRNCVVVLRGLELRARHAVLSNRSLRGRTAAVHPQKQTSGRWFGRPLSANK